MPHDEFTLVHSTSSTDNNLSTGVIDPNDITYYSEILTPVGTDNVVSACSVGDIPSGKRISELCNQGTALSPGR